MHNQKQQQHEQAVRAYLTRQQQQCQERWEEISELMHRLKKARIRETDEAIRFKLDRQIQDLQQDEAQLEQEIQVLETDLRDLDVPEQISACLDKYPLPSTEATPRQEPPTSEPDDEILAYCRKIETLHEKMPLLGFQTSLRVPIRIPVPAITSRPLSFRTRTALLTIAIVIWTRTYHLLRSNADSGGREDLGQAAGDLAEGDYVYRFVLRQ